MPQDHRHSALGVTKFDRTMNDDEIDGLLAEEVKRIFDGYARNGKRLGDKRKTWGESARDWMLAEVYALVRKLRRLDQLQAIDRAIAQTPREKTKGRADMSKYPFKQALYLIFGEAMAPGSDCKVDRRRRPSWADALEYADAHNVQTKFLNGFIKQAGITSCRAKLEAGFEEPRWKRKILPSKAKNSSSSTGAELSPQRRSVSQKLPSSPITPSRPKKKRKRKVSRF